MNIKYVFQKVVFALTVSLFCAFSLSAQINVTGTVNDDTGGSLPGVNVIVKGTATGVVTDANGRYDIVVPNEEAVLVFSFVGFATQEIVVSNQRSIDVSMAEDSQQMEEVVVVGYGTQKRETVTGSISTVSTKTLTQSPVANISNSLAGRMPGLFSLQRTGEPGRDEAQIRIRGTGTFAGSTNPLIMIDGIEALNYNNIDPNEIESLSVLKDASATAVFGVRGANGVILINTKRGNAGPPVLNISSNVGISSFTELRKNVGAYDWAVLMNEALRYNSYISGTYTPMWSAEEIEHFRTGDDPIFYPDVDWISLLLKPYAIQTQHNLNIRGGTELVKYFVSAGYLLQDGLIDSNNAAHEGMNPETKYQRFNVRTNFDFEITKRLSASLDFSAQIDTKKYPGSGTDDGFTRYLTNRIMQAPPYIFPGIVDGKIVNTRRVQIGNPIELMVSNGFSNRSANNITATVMFKYDLDFITKGLRAHGKVSNWNNMQYVKTVYKSTQTYRLQRLDDGTIAYLPEKTDDTWGFGEYSPKNRKISYEFALNYEKTFGSHNVTGLLLYNQDKQYDPGLEYQIPRGFQGLVGRVTYNYKMRYLAEFNIGYNGNENFTQGKRFGTFPAYSVGWVVSEEPFFPKNDIISYIKIRGTYGEVGNVNIGGSRFLYMPAAYSYGESYNLGIPGSTWQSYPASSESRLGNPNVTWERAKKSDVGIDLTFFNSRLKVTAEYFHELRNDILATPGTTPQSLGISLPLQNWGSVKNSGYEAEISFSDDIGEFNYWLRGNYSFARNEILFQDEAPRINTPYQLRTGQSIGQFFGLVAEGFYNTWEEVNDANRVRSQYTSNRIMPGDVKYKDINGDSIINDDDAVPMGYSEFPEIMYGFSFGGAFKGFDFSVLFQGAANFTRRSSVADVRPFELDLMCTTFIPEYSWTQEKYENGETIKLPHLTARQANDHNYRRSNLFMLQDASYLRLKNAEIGYNFTNDFLSRLAISSCRIYLNGNNLLTWHGMFPGNDPEQEPIEGDFAPYPMTKVFNLGINLTF